jgi:flagellin-like protein
LIKIESKRRGISELIGTLVLLMVTAAGSSFLALIVNGSGLESTSESQIAPVAPTYSVRLVGYDTRDGSDLVEITTLDNKFDTKLCTTGCQVTPDNTPNNFGTDFIVLQIKNVSPNPIFIRNIQINGITHTWDQQTGTKTFDASINDFSGKYPLNGKFSILPASSLVQKSDNKLTDDEEIQLVIKLSKDITSDISLSKPIQVLVDFGGIKATQFVISSGETK